MTKRYKDILDHIAKKTGLTETEILSGQKRRNIIARKALCYVVCRELGSEYDAAVLTGLCAKTMRNAITSIDNPRDAATTEARDLCKSICKELKLPYFKKAVKREKVRPPKKKFYTDGDERMIRKAIELAKEFMDSYGAGEAPSNGYFKRK